MFLQDAKASLRGEYREKWSEVCMGDPANKHYLARGATAKNNNTHPPPSAAKNHRERGFLPHAVVARLIAFDSSN